MNTSNRSRGAGRINREFLASRTQEEIDALAAAERRGLGIPEQPQLRYERADLRPNARAIRERLHLSQQQFADRFGLRVKTIRHWEQQRTIPDRSAVVLLKTIEIAPDVVERAVWSMARCTTSISLGLLPTRVGVPFLAFNSTSHGVAQSVNDQRCQTY
jgi:putative transcriptional regulator